MRIYLLTSRKRFPIEVDDSTRIEQLEAVVHEKEGLPIGSFQLIYEERLESGSTVSSCGLREGATIEMIEAKQHMLPFTHSNDTSNPLIKFLMNPETKNLITKALQEKGREQGAGPFCTYRYVESNKTDCWLDPYVRQLLSKFLDFMWEMRAPVGTVDMWLVFSDVEFHRLVSACFACLFASSSSSSQSPDVRGLWVLQSLHGSFSEIPNAKSEKKIAMCITRGPTKSCVNFHCDGGHASATVQVALNDSSEYTGGHLCFFVNDNLEILKRSVGSMTQYPAKVLYGVTSLTKGTRKSLFVVDQANGLGEGAVVVVNEKEVNEFAELLKSRISVVSPN